MLLFLMFIYKPKQPWNPKGYKLSPVLTARLNYSSINYLNISHSSISYLNVSYSNISSLNWFIDWSAKISSCKVAKCGMGFTEHISHKHLLLLYDDFLFIFRPWYPNIVNTEEGKEYVIVVDFSSSMKPNLLEKAKKVVDYILKMVDSKDKVFPKQLFTLHIFFFLISCSWLLAKSRNRSLRKNHVHHI